MGKKKLSPLVVIWYIHPPYGGRPKVIVMMDTHISGNKPLPEPMLAQIFIAIYGVTRPQWVNPMPVKRFQGITTGLKKKKKMSTQVIIWYVHLPYCGHPKVIVMMDTHIPFVFCQLALPILNYSCFQYLTLKIQGRFTSTRHSYWDKTTGISKFDLEKSKVGATYLTQYLIDVLPFCFTTTGPTIDKI